MIKQEKIVIIGSGLGGLSSGVILATRNSDWWMLAVLYTSWCKV